MHITFELYEMDDSYYSIFLFEETAARRNCVHLVPHVDSFEEAISLIKNRDTYKEWPSDGFDNASRMGTLLVDYPCKNRMAYSTVYTFKERLGFTTRKVKLTQRKQIADAFLK